MAQSARTAQWLAGRTSLVERATSLSPPARRTPTTSTTPTGREGNVALPDWAWVHLELRRPNVTLGSCIAGEKLFVDFAGRTGEIVETCRRNTIRSLCFVS